MSFLSAKQIAELWGISPRRVAFLASNGRIPGARQQYGRWLIPEDAAKPADPRRKDACVQQKPSERYIFPFLISIIHSDEQLQNLTAEEKELYRLCLIFEEGRFAEARTVAEGLLLSSNPYVRMGAMYYLASTCMYLADYQSSDKYLILIHTVYESEILHRKELDFLIAELDAELGRGSDFLEKMRLDDMSEYSDSVIGLIALYDMFSALIKLISSASTPNIAAYEIICHMTETQGYFYCAMTMHLYLSAFYSSIHDKEKECFHFRTALDSGIEHGLFFTISSYMLINSETAEKILSEYEPGVGDRIRQLSKLLIAGRSGYSDFHKNPNALFRLRPEDYALIACCLKKNSIDQMAKIFGLTRSGINKRLAALYEKLGVKSRNEMLRIYCSCLLDW